MKLKEFEKMFLMEGITNTECHVFIAIGNLKLRETSFSILKRNAFLIMKIKSLQGAFFSYLYKEKRDYKTITDRFVRNTTIALDFLVKNNTLTISFPEEDTVKTVDIMDVLMADSTNNICIVPGNKNAYYHKHNAIMFYDTHAVVFRKNHKKNGSEVIKDITLL